MSATVLITSFMANPPIRDPIQDPAALQGVAMSLVSFYVTLTFWKSLAVLQDVP